MKLGSKWIQFGSSVETGKRDGYAIDYARLRMFVLKQRSMIVNKEHDSCFCIFFTVVCNAVRINGDDL